MFDLEKYKKLKSNLEGVVKKLINYENRPLPTDQGELTKRITSYKNELTIEYNKYVNYIAKYWSTYDQGTKTKLAETVGTIKLRVLRALKAINLSTDLPNNLEELKPELIVNFEEAFVGADTSQIFVRGSALTRDDLPTDEEGAVGGTPSTADKQQTQQQRLPPQNSISLRQNQVDPNEIQIVDGSGDNSTDNITVNPNGRIRVKINSTGDLSSDSESDLNVFSTRSVRNKKKMSDEENNGNELQDLQTASRTITTTYNGDIKSLGRFLASLRLAVVGTVATTTTTAPFDQVS